MGFSDTSPLLNRSSSEHMFDTMAMEIEQLLTKVRHWLPMGSKLSYIYCTIFQCGGETVMEGKNEKGNSTAEEQIYLL